MRGTSSAGRRRIPEHPTDRFAPRARHVSPLCPRSDTIPRMAEDTLTITDNRTGRDYTVAIVDGTIRATDLRQISAGEGDGGLMSYDPAYLNTASCRSAITYIDGDAGILR